jgi:hypothetical protein
MDIHDKNWTWCLKHKKYDEDMEDVLLTDSIFRMDMEQAIRHYYEWQYDVDVESFLVYKKDGKITYPYTISEGQRILKLELL